jgi:hypothetical protein
MASGTIRIMVATLVIAALAGCQAGNAPPGTPGSMTVYLHGRTEADMGASTR